jgi:hypothetical protein
MGVPFPESARSAHPESTGERKRAKHPDRPAFPGGRPD